MDEELRKAQRVFERAGIRGLLPEDEFIMKQVFEFIRKDKSLLLNFLLDSHQTRSVTNYLNSPGPASGDREQALISNPVLLPAIRYYTGLSKLVCDEVRAALSP